MTTDFFSIELCALIECLLCARHTSGDAVMNGTSTYEVMRSVVKLSPAPGHQPKKQGSLLLLHYITLTPAHSFPGGKSTGCGHRICSLALNLDCSSAGPQTWVVVILHFFNAFFPLPCSPLIPGSPPTVAHVHESFVLSAQSHHPRPPLLT